MPTIYEHEVELLYNLRFERGLSPNPQAFKHERVQGIAQQISNLIWQIEFYDDQIKKLYEEIHPERKENELES